nr:MAG TPA: hypothetical protein [Caudoviricetes sp.]
MTLPTLRLTSISAVYLRLLHQREAYGLLCKLRLPATATIPIQPCRLLVSCEHVFDKCVSV